MTPKLRIGVTPNNCHSEALAEESRFRTSLRLRFFTSPASAGFVQNDSSAVPIQRVTADYTRQYSAKAELPAYKKRLLRQAPGFTLVEVMVALGIFIFLAVAMTGFLQRGIDMWRGGEATGDVNERGLIVMEQITKDINDAFSNPDTNTVAINNFYQALPLDKTDFVEPSLFSRLDSQGNQWLYFTAIDSNDYYRLISTTPTISPTYVRNIRRIVYWQDNSAGRPQLCRGMVDEATALAFWSTQQEQSGNVPFARNPQRYDDILYLGCKFTQPLPNGPGFSNSAVWDSRQVPAVVIQNGTFPNFPQNIPKVIKVMLDIKSLPLNAPKITLAENVGAGAGQFKVSLARTLISAGGFIKINGEWMVVTGKNQYSLSVTRGARSTMPTGHSIKDEVQYGDSITNTLIIRQ